jgi:ATP-dependent DNA helicase RecG
LPEEIDYEGKKLLVINVPMSSQVHRCNGKIFDRNGDSDIDITLQNQKVAELYIRKQSTYTENEIIPYVRIENLRSDLIRKTRLLAINLKPNHPWETLSNLDMLKSSQLYQKDYRTGKDGFTIAAVLLFGKDNIILSILPHYKTDAILRRENIDRYDDCDDIRTNLIESYERLMAFVAKHLPDKFYLEKDQRVSLRDKIFREVISNILIQLNT